ncbi:unnamed protein product [Angiostrongylus costaricensis]|uniref:Uncharacterized protein n=1 Tax=Angiostrongylus costaricensis TaxID=334426 RepID=A0A0R3PR65_ANGCS|nr:unnamed protein product [Angiostrongylus costaricensis]
MIPRSATPTKLDERCRLSRMDDLRILRIPSHIGANRPWLFETVSICFSLPSFPMCPSAVRRAPFPLFSTQIINPSLVNVQMAPPGPYMGLVDFLTLYAFLSLNKSFKHMRTLSLCKNQFTRPGVLRELTFVSLWMARLLEMYGVMIVSVS